MTSDERLRKDLVTPVPRHYTMTFTDRIKAQAHTLGFDLVGVTPAASPAYEDAYADWLARGFAGEMTYMARYVEKRRHPGHVLPGARSLIVVAMNYRASDAETIPDDQPLGVIARYARGRDYHDVMTARLEELLTFIRSEAGCPVQGKVYVDTGPILEREFAVLAGLGWFGKHSNLINKRLGSWLLLGEILLDVELAYDRPTTAHCGTCTRCIEACPTEAIVEPYVVDARRCISYLTIELKGAIPDEFRTGMGNRIFGCDDCQDVCPWNRRAPVTGEPDFFPRQSADAPGLIELLRMTPDDFRTRFKGSPIKRAKRRGLLRNTAVALGNTGDPQAIPPLVEALHDEEPLIRGHAAWALGQLGGDRARQALAEATEQERETAVLAEMEKALRAIDGRPLERA